MCAVEQEHCSSSRLPIQPDVAQPKYISSAIAELCARYGVVLVIDSSFRMYNRDLYDDVALLLRSGVSFIAFEDTGKSFPTLDTKASSFTHRRIWRTVSKLCTTRYIYASGISLLLLSRAFERTRQLGIGSVLWSMVDQRRMLLRAALAGSGLHTSKAFTRLLTGMAVYWFRRTERHRGMRPPGAMGVAALTGRQFFWASQDRPRNQRHIRLSMMKPSRRFNAALRILEQAAFHRKVK